MSKRKRAAPKSRPAKKARTQIAVIARPNRFAVPATRGYRFNNVEKKVNDNAPATYAVNTTGTFQLLCVPTRGDDMNQRNGRKIMLRSFYIKGSVESNWAANPSAATVQIPSQEVTMIVFMDYQPNGALPTVADLLTTATSNAHLNLNNRDRFKVLCTKTWEIGPISVVSTATQAVSNTAGNQLFKVRVYKKIRQEMVFNAGNTGTITDINSGALYMFWIGSSAASATLAASAGIATRVRYTDI